MMTAIVGVVCLCFGLAAGKRRAKGDGWGRIIRDIAGAVWYAIAWPFRKERPEIEVVK
jgi:hypothetical protein